MYRDYLTDPSSVAESWRDFFSDYEPPGQSRQNPRRAEPAAPVRMAPPAPAAPLDRPDNGHGSIPEGAQPIRGVASTIAENMNASRSMPTATSIRDVPAKLLEVNRRILNNQLGRTRGGKVSFTHLIGWAIVRAIAAYPAMTSTYYEVDGKGYVRRPDSVNLGLAVDVERKGGARTLLVPNIKDVMTLEFEQFFRAYEEIIRRVKTNKLDPELFADTTVTLTNPGTVGTIGSVPRLMPGSPPSSASAPSTTRPSIRARMHAPSRSWVSARSSRSRPPMTTASSRVRSRGCS